MWTTGSGLVQYYSMPYPLRIQFSLWDFKHDTYCGSVIALIEVEAALHANTLLSIQLSKHKLTFMSLH